MKNLATLLLLCFASFGIVKAETEPNNSRAQANPITIGATGSGILGAGGDNDWWVFTIPEDGNITINITCDKYIYCVIYDNDGIHEFSNTNGVTSFSPSVAGLGAGTYYFKVYNYFSTDSSNYTVNPVLTLTGIANDVEPNASIAQAGTLNLNDSVFGHIGYYYNNADDTLDWWKVTTNLDGRLDYTITSLNGQNIYAELFASNGTTLLAGSYTTTSTTYSRDGLAPGIYYIRIRNYFIGEFSPYKLSNNLVLPANVAETGGANDSPASARVINVNDSVNGHVGYSDFANSRDTMDYYKFTTSQDGQINLKLDVFNNQNVYAYILDGDGNTVLAGNYTTTFATYSRDGLAAGTYYVKVINYYTAVEFSPYAIKVTLNSTVPNDPEQNGTTASAITINLNDSVTGHIGYYYNNLDDTLDWYKVTTTEDGQINFKITSLNGQNVYALLYDNDGVTNLAGSYTTNTTTFSANGLAAGTYYIKIMNYAIFEWSPYSLKVTLDPVPDNDVEQNGTLGTALVLPLATTMKGHIGYYYNHEKDTADYYALTLPVDGKLSYTITSGNGQNVYANLYDHNGTTYLAGSYTTSSATFGRNDLAAGTYYIRVNNYAIGEFSTYTLTATLEPMNFLAENSADNSFASTPTLLPANIPTGGHINFYYNLISDNPDWWIIGYDGATGTMALHIDEEQNHFNTDYPYINYEVYLDTAASPIASGQVHAPANTISLSGLSINKYYLKITQGFSTFGAYQLNAVYTERCLTNVAINSSSQQAGCLGTIVYGISNGLSPYTVQLYKDGVPYGSPVSVASTATFNNLPLGNYFAKAYSFGGSGICNNQSTNTVFAPPAVPTVSVSGPTTFCQGGSVTLTSSAAVTYLWSTGATTQAINVSASGNYTVTVFDIFGCSNISAAKSVIVNPNPSTPVITPGGSITFCQGGSVTLTSSVEAFYHWSTGATTQGITVNTNATVTDTVINVNGCRAVSAPLTVTVNATPTTANAGPDQTVCASTATLAANTPSVGTGLWNIVSGSGGSFSLNSNPVATFTGTPGVSYTLRWAISNGVCTPSADTVNITLNANPTTANAGPDQTVCASGATLAANTPSIGTGLWSIVSGSGGSFSLNSNPAAAFTGTPGTSYILRWAISNGVCITSVDSVNITLNANPSTANAGPDQTVCGNTATLAANTPSVGSGLWNIVSGSGGSFSLNSNPAATFTGVQGTTYILRWAISNGVCASSADSVTITLSANPSAANAGPDQNICNTSTSLAANTPSVGTGLWNIVSGSGGSLSNNSNPAATFTGTAGNSYILRWAISNGACAVSADSVSIVIASGAITANAGPDQNVCGTSATLAANNPSPGTGAWRIISGSGGSVSDSTNASATFSGITGNTYSLRWTVTNGACAPAMDTVNISFSANPSTANAGPDQNICSTSATLAANSPSVGTGLWNILTGSGGSFSLNSNPAATFTGTSGVTYTLKWTISSGACASSSDTVVISITSGATTSNAGSDQNICGTSTTLAANNPSPGTGAWRILSGSGGSFSDTTSSSSSFNGTAGTSYALRWTVANGVCSSASDTVIITFNANPTSANAGPDQVVCGNSATLAANAPSVGTGLWNVVNGSGGSFSGNGNARATFTGTPGAAYILRWTISNGACPSSADSVNITLNAIPSASNAGPDQTVCGTSATLAANVPSVGTGLWNIVSGSGGSFSLNSNPIATFTGTPGTTYTLRWAISNGVCPSSVDTVNITLNANPSTANAGPDQTVCGTTATLTANTPSVGSGLWNIVSGSGGSFSLNSNPAATFNGTPGTTYTLRWAISNGACAVSADTVKITLNVNPSTANAGADRVTCGNSVTLAANVPSIGTGLWNIISGSGGSFSVNSNPAATFTGTPGTSYALRWTISNGVCVASSDTVNVTLNTAPVVTLGSFASVCSNVATFTLTGGSPAGGTYSGTGVSGGQFNPATSGVGTFTITYLYSGGGCPASATSTITVTNCGGGCTTAPATPSGISGLAYVCRLQNNITYSIPVVATATSYAWALPSGMAGSSTGTSITVSTNNSFNGGNICVKAVNTCGNSLNSCLYISRATTAPSCPGSISGPATACGGSTKTYIVSSVSQATLYTWSYPAGSIVSGQGTTSLTVTFPLNFASGNICVSASNCKGSSSTRCITVTSVPSAPCFLFGYTEGVCGRSNLSYSTFPVSGATSYSWSLPAGATFVGPNNGTSIRVNFTPAFGGGNICVTANNSCGSSAARCIAVHGEPGAVCGISGRNNVCRSQHSVSYSISSIFGATSYQWTATNGAVVNGSGTSVTLNFAGVTASPVKLTVKGINSCGTGVSQSIYIAVANCREAGPLNEELPVVIDVYPNPTSGTFNISLANLNSENARVTVTDVQGRVVFGKTINTNLIPSVQVDLTENAQGIYMIEVNDNGKIWMKKLVKE